MSCGLTHDKMRIPTRHPPSNACRHVGAARRLLPRRTADGAAGSPVPDCLRGAAPAPAPPPGACGCAICPPPTTSGPAKLLPAAPATDLTSDVCIVLGHILLLPMPFSPRTQMRQLQTET